MTWKITFSVIDNMAIPSLPDGLVIDGGDEIDQSDVDVAAFITAMTSGMDIGGNVINPCEYGGDDITTLVYAIEKVIKS